MEKTRLDQRATTIYFDGSSLGRGRRGGPGASAAAVWLLHPDETSEIQSRYIRLGDSDLAEYEALILGLTLAKERGATTLRIYGDSRNVIDQVLGLKSVKKVSLRHCLEEVNSLLLNFPDWSLQWIPRDKNGVADAAARRCIETRGLEAALMTSRLEDLVS